jgi:uncharacterized membrane protein YeaQ/YmgE (transglycosylase-associated protein family)
MDISFVDLVIWIVSGAIGGYLAGTAIRDLSLGMVGNLIAGAIGGLIGGYSLRAAIPVLGSTAGGISFGVIIGQVVTGLVAGAILTAIVGLSKDMVSARPPG